MVEIKKGKFMFGPWEFLLVILSIVGSTFGVGFYVGDFKRSLEKEVEQVKFQQECNERIHQAESACRQQMDSRFHETVKNVETFMQKLERKENGK